MGIELILKIAGIGILTSVVNQVLKHTGKDEITTFTTLASIMIVLMMVLNLVSDLFSTVQTLFNLY